MRKKLLKYFMIAGCLSTVCMMFLFFQITKNNEINRELEGLNVTLDQIVQDVSSNKEKADAAKSKILAKDRRILFVMDRETGEIVGVSENRDQEMNVENGLDAIIGLTGRGGIIQVNGKKYIAAAKEYENYLVVYMSEKGKIIRSVYHQLEMILLAVLCVFSSISLFLYFMLDQLILKDISSISNNLEQVFNRDYQVEFKTGKTKEIAEIARKLGKLISSFQMEQKKLTRIMSMLGEEVGAYEYYGEIGGFFCSENLPNMVEMTEEEIRTMGMKHYEDMKNHIGCKLIPGSGTMCENKEYMETKSGKSIRVRRTYFGGGIYVFLEDMTNNRKEIADYKRQLTEEQEKNERDALTGLYNRRKVEEAVEEMFRTENPQGVLILLDLDNFKRVNDGEGHMEGDILLKKVSHILTEHFRDTDIRARLGGDEFIVFIKNSLPPKVLDRKLERLLQKTRTALWGYYKEYKLSVSIGGVYINSKLNGFEEAYQIADRAMYISKKNGKDSFYIES